MKYATSKLLIAQKTTWQPIKTRVRQLSKMHGSNLFAKMGNVG